MNHIRQRLLIGECSLTALGALLLLTPVAGATELQDAPTPKLLPVTAEVQTLVATALHGVAPRGTAVHGGRNRNGVYTLSGDLFDDGNIYAVLDTSPIIICRWTTRHWEPLTVIDDTAAWKYAGWEKEREGREPVSSRPFWLLHLQYRPLLAIALYVEKAGQNYSVILFDKGLQHISDVAHSISSFPDTPVIKGDYLLTQDESRVKAEWI